MGVESEEPVDSLVFSMGPLTAAWRTEQGEKEESHPSAKKALKPHLLACHSSPKSTATGATKRATMFQLSPSTDPEQHSQLLGEKRPQEEHLMRRGFRDWRPGLEMLREVFI